MKCPLSVINENIKFVKVYCFIDQHKRASSEMAYLPSFMLFIWTSQVTQWQRICLAVQETNETRVRSLDREDPLEEEEMATHSSSLAWTIPWTEEPGGLLFMESQRIRHNREHTHILLTGFE